MRSRLNRSAGLLLILGTVYAVQSCDRHAPTEIRPRGLLPTPPLLDLSPPPLGTYNIPVPPENNFKNNGGSAPWAYTGIRIPAYSAYVITVNGRVSTKKNPAWYCQGTNSWPYDGHSYGPLGTGANYDLLVNLRVWNFGANQYTPVSLPGVGGDSAPTQVKTDTVFTWYDQDLEAQRNGINFACDTVGGYLMQGSQTLTVEEITNTLKLTPSEYYVHPGTRVSFTASMADGSPLSTTISWAWMADSLHARSVGGICGQNANPCSVTPTVSGTVRVAGFVLGKGHEAKGHVTVYNQFTLEADKTSVNSGDTVVFVPKLDGKQVTAQTWKWIPQDTSQHDAAGCANTNSCSKAMVSSGTMKAYLTTPGASDSASVAVTVQPVINLNCTPGTLSRGGNVECLASATGNLIISSWSFASSDGRFMYNRATNVQSTSWNGPMVAGGTVTVTGTVNGNAARAGTALINVTPRSGWSWKADTSYSTNAPECFSQPHYLNGPLGWTIGPSCDHLTIVLTPDPSIGDAGVPVQRIADGPNTELWYIPSMSTGLHIRSQLLKDYRVDGTAYAVTVGDSVANGCRLYWPTYPNATSFTLTQVNVDCMSMTGPFQYTDLVAYIWQHEKCHGQRDNYGFERVPDVRSAAESQVGYDSGQVAQPIRGQLQAVNDSIFRFSKAIDNDTVATPYTYWSRDSTNSLWLHRYANPIGIIPGDGICQ